MNEINKEEFKKDIENYAKVLFRKSIKEASDQEKFQAVSYAVKDIVVDQWMATHKTYEEQDVKTVYYLSMEFLTGRALGNIIINLKGNKAIKEAVEELGLDLDVIEDQEPDAALGNGGLGRLAACFLDSLSTLGYPAYGCGIRYKYGMFKQVIENGYQIEKPDDWLKNGNPFEIKRPEYAVEVKFGGYVAMRKDEFGRDKFVQENYQSVLAVPYDLPVVGYNNNVVNTLRIWDAEAIDTFNLDSFDKGDYQKAVEQQNLARTICEVLYPNDNHMAGKELRLKQQYFFVSASVQRAVAKYMEKHDDIRKIYEKVCFQLNDTHPTVAVAELMRILLDEEGLSWDEAWEITTKTCAYTNHTIMAEALEKWPVDLFSRLLPRIYQIVEEINRRFVLDIQQKYSNVPGVDVQEKIRKMAIIYDGQVKMAHMAIAGSFSVNGVARLHTEILEKQELKDFYEMMPEKFKNVTNGIDHRRWASQINRGLDGLICDLAGDGYLTHPQELKKLEAYADDASVLKRLEEIKHQNKLAFAAYAKKQQGVVLNTDAIFDVQVKRLHEYKRQLLNVLHIIYLYQRLRDDPNMEMRPQTFLFGAKAAPGYAVAKRIIHLINSLAAQIDRDPICKDKLQVVFLENYRVSLAEKLMPASEVSQQISTAGKEASGTGNMKFMMNGALTVGTLDGANVEMHEVLGDENMFLFGLKADEVARLRHTYDPQLLYQRDPVLRRVVDQLKTGFGDGVTYEDIWQRLVMGGDGPADQYMVLADFAAYCDAEERMCRTYGDRTAWNRMSLRNIARSGIFAADRAIAQYADTIWHVPYKK